MSVLEKIKKLFEENKIEYSTVEHEPIITSADAARVCDTKLYLGAKSLVFKADEVPVLIVIPGDKKVDLKKFKELFNLNNLELVSQEELTQVTGLERGSVCPLGKVLNLKSYYDDCFKTYDTVMFSAGLKTVSIAMKASDLIKVEEPIFGNFIL